MRLLQFFLHLFEKPTKRNPLNAGICYFLVLPLFGLFYLVLSVGEAIELIGSHVLLIAIFTFGALAIRLCEQAGEWLHPKVSRCCNQHRWR